MTREMKILSIQNRLNKLYGTEKNIKSPGVIRKLERQLRNLKSYKFEKD